MNLLPRKLTIQLVEPTTQRTIRVESTRIESIRPLFLASLFAFLCDFFQVSRKSTFQLVESTTQRTIRVVTTLTNRVSLGVLDNPRAFSFNLSVRVQEESFLWELNMYLDRCILERFQLARCLC